MDVGTLNDGLSPDIHRSMPIASLRPIACFHPLFVASLIDRFLALLPERLLDRGL